MNVGQSWRWELEARGRELIVTLPGTSYRVIYRQHQNSPKLVTAIVPKGNERGALVSREEFLARALRLANGKARELGWFEQLKARTSQAHEGGSLPAEVGHGDHGLVNRAAAGEILNKFCPTPEQVGGAFKLVTVLRGRKSCSHPGTRQLLSLRD